eukprot:NODE_35_length_31537_cov_0.293403.p24 type:complete len:107 gc:universal NODE_35_length_31537_cov_0.293403:9610-9290(-)
MIEILGNDDKAPHGCMSEAVSATNAVYLLVKGQVDIQKEVLRLKKKVAKAENNLKSTVKQTEINGYTTKVPEAVQLSNKEKIDLLKTELTMMQDTINKLKAIDLEK